MPNYYYLLMLWSAVTNCCESNHEYSIINTNREQHIQVDFDSLSKVSIEDCYQSYKTEFGEVPFYLGVQIDTLNIDRMSFKCFPMFTIEEIWERCFTAIYLSSSRSVYVKFNFTSRFKTNCIAPQICQEISPDIPQFKDDFSKLINYNVRVVTLEGENLKIEQIKNDDFYERKPSIIFKVD